MSSRNARVLITGVAGFIGSQLAAVLTDRGYEVHGIDNLIHGEERNLVSEGKDICAFNRLDIRSPDLVKYMSGIDFVFHLAAISSLAVCQLDPLEAVSVNVAGTANVLEAARQSGVKRTVFASSSAIYENNTTFPCKEEDNVGPTLIYALTKWQAEMLCKSFVRNYSSDIVVTRYYNVYGPHQNIVRQSPPFVGYVIRELLAGRRPQLHGDGSQRRDYVYLDDIIEMNIACMERHEAARETFNVASGHAWSVNELYQQIAILLETDIEPTFRSASEFWNAYPGLFSGKYPLSRKAVETEVDKFTLGSTRHAADRLGWKANTDLRHGLAKTIAYFRHAMEQA